MIRSIDTARKLPDGTYDIGQYVVRSGYTVTLRSFTCTKRHEMRMDLVALDLLGSTSDMEVLMALNAIVDPYSVRSGDVLYAVAEEDVPEIRSREDELKNVREALLDAAKAQRKDKNRSDYASSANERQADKLLPATVIRDRQSQLENKDGFIVITPDL